MRGGGAKLAFIGFKVPPPLLFIANLTIKSLTPHSNESSSKLDVSEVGSFTGRRWICLTFKVLLLVQNADHIISEKYELNENFNKLTAVKDFAVVLVSSSELTQ